jgi:hypothetical protein
MTQLQLDARPETCGLLSEPPRRPPTAIGAATLPPPNEGYPRRHAITRRIALGMLAILFAVAALPLASSGSAGRTTIATGFVAASLDAGVQAATGSAHPWRAVVAPAAWRLLKEAAAVPARLGSRHGRRSGPPVTTRLAADADDEDRPLQRRRRNASPNEG